MGKRTKWVLAITAVAVLAAIAWRFLAGAKPVDQSLLAADHVDFIGELPVPDGGSITFFFLLPHSQPMALLVRHRDPRFGANPEFQEIWLDRYGGFNPHIDVSPATPLESKLVGLLLSATIKTNAGEHGWEPPNPERLKWIIQRIQDRKSPW
jgi:hypothetical protein